MPVPLSIQTDDAPSLSTAPWGQQTLWSIVFSTGFDDDDTCTGKAIVIEQCSVLPFATFEVWMTAIGNNATSFCHEQDNTVVIDDSDSPTLSWHEDGHCVHTLGD